MRYIPNVMAAATFDAGPYRPKLSELPKPLAKILTERDELGVRLNAAQARVNELASEGLDAAAQRQDDEEAAAAARAGKPIPRAARAERLAQDRHDAARALEAHVTAHTALTGEANEVRDQVRDYDGRDALRKEARERIAALAEKLADEVEAAVRSLAVQDYLCDGSYNTEARTWPTEVCPSLGNRIQRHDTTHEPVRGIITRAALTVLED
jgi:chromosome segregation ATPase